ncbi:MAG: hypothetical protein ACYCW6_11135 [Candidatus Xenobia bacterium]
MFHKHLLGPHGEDAPCDDHGYIPEPGDHWTGMHWPEGATWTEEAWQAFKQRAQAYVAAARPDLMPSLC